MGVWLCGRKQQEWRIRHPPPPQARKSPIWCGISVLTPVWCWEQLKNC